MSNISELKRELKELALDISIAQGRYNAVLRMITLAEVQRRADKQSKCNHRFEKQSERHFDSQGFEDIEYQYCAKCKKVEDQRVVNSVKDSERY